MSTKNGFYSKDGLNAWAPVTHMGEQHASLGSWCQPGPLPLQPFEPAAGISSTILDLCLSNKNKCISFFLKWAFNFAKKFN